MRCEAPAAAGEAVPLVVGHHSDPLEGDDGDALSLLRAPEPTVEALKPALGHVRGGTTLRVLGDGFGEGSALSCWFGTIGPVPAAVVSAGELACVAPARPPGVVGLAVGAATADRVASSPVYRYALTHS